MITNRSHSKSEIRLIWWFFGELLLLQLVTCTKVECHIYVVTVRFLLFQLAEMLSGIVELEGKVLGKAMLDCSSYTQLDEIAKDKPLGKWFYLLSAIGVCNTSASVFVFQIKTPSLGLWKYATNIQSCTSLWVNLLRRNGIKFRTTEFCTMVYKIWLY